MVAEPVEEMPSISGFEFWGATVVPGKTVKCEITGNILHITSIAMDENIANDPKQRSVLSVIIDGKQFVLASLKEGVCEQIAVDFLFRENKPVKFKVTGKTTLHLVGYLQPLDLGFDDEEIESDEEDDEMCESDEDDSCDNEEGVSDDDEDEEMEHSDEAMPATEETGGKKRPADVAVEVTQEKIPKKSKKSSQPADEPKSDSTKEVKSEPKKTESVKEVKQQDSEPKKTDKSEKADVKKSEESKPVPESVKEVKPSQVVEPAEPKKTNKSDSKKADTTESESAQAKKAEDSKPKVESASGKDSESKKQGDFRKLAGGVMVKDTHIGEGKVASKGKRLGVMYKGMFKNGKVFDSNMDSNKPFFFKMGNGDVVKGWDIGFEGMKVGGKRLIVCPPKMAYGKEGSPPEIPPNSVLVFEVELVNVK